jgi:hypothetical protein
VRSVIKLARRYWATKAVIAASHCARPHRADRFGHRPSSVALLRGLQRRQGLAGGLRGRLPAGAATVWSRHPHRRAGQHAHRRPAKAEADLERIAAAMDDAGRQLYGSAFAAFSDALNRLQMNGVEADAPRESSSRRSRRVRRRRDTHRRGGKGTRGRRSPRVGRHTRRDAPGSSRPGAVIRTTSRRHRMTQAFTVDSRT